jgi:hypothetical protein
MGTSIREALESAVSEQEEKESITTDTPETPVVETQAVETPVVESEPVGETAEQRSIRLRDEKGRFAEGKVEAKTDVKANPVQAPVSKVPKPDSWKKELQADWDALTPKQQEYIKSREDQYFKGISTYQQEWKSAKPLLDAVAPFLPTLEAHGIQPGEWVSNLGRAHYTLANGTPQARLQMFQKLAHDYGVPLQALTDFNVAQQYQHQQQQQIPQQQAPQPDVDALIEQKLFARDISKEITNFEQAKDSSGNALYPHYQTVRPDMALLLQAGKANDLKSAYNMALRLHDDLFASEQEAKRKADDTARLEAQRKAVAVAKGNSVSVRSATPASTGAAPKTSRREALSDAYDQHMSAGRI